MGKGTVQGPVPFKPRALSLDPAPQPLEKVIGWITDFSVKNGFSFWTLSLRIKVCEILAAY